MKESTPEEQAETEIKALRASNAAIKAENEALTVELARINRVHVESCDAFEVLDKMADKYQAQLKRYTTWTPQDPGTKEAMPRSDEKCDTHGDRPVVSHCPYCSWLVLAHALRAAMVRLEEAEKKNAQNLENATSNEVIAERLNAALQERIRHLESVNALPCGPDHVAAIAASLASMTKERDDYREGAAVEAHAGDEARAELAELRKRMDLMIPIVEMFAFMEDKDWNAWKPQIKPLLAALASPPSPAPVESKPKPFHECGPECYATPPAADTAKPSPEAKP